MDWYRDQCSNRIVEATPDNDLSLLRSTQQDVFNRESQYVREQVLNDVKRLMENLPPTQREVVYMRFYQEMSFKEIADATGVSINTSLGRMRYAVLNLRRMAREHGVILQLD